MSPSFVRYDFNIGDEIELQSNPCNTYCQCVWSRQKAPFLEEGRKYIIKEITYFGGGCPSELLHLEGVLETYKNLDNPLDSGVPANWFKSNRRVK